MDGVYRHAGGCFRTYDGVVSLHGDAGIKVGVFFSLEPSLLFLFSYTVSWEEENVEKVVSST